MQGRPRALSRLPSFSQLSAQNRSPSVSRSNTSRKLSIDNIVLREDQEYLNSLYKRSQFLQTWESRAHLEKIFSNIQNQPTSAIDFSEDEDGAPKKQYWGMLTQSLLNPFSRAHSTLLKLMKENVSKKIRAAHRTNYFRRGSKEKSPSATPRRTHSQESVWSEMKEQKDANQKPLLKIDDMKKRLIDIVNSHQQACQYVNEISKKMSSSSVKKEEEIKEQIPPERNKSHLNGNETRRFTLYEGNKRKLSEIKADRSKLTRWKAMSSPEVNAFARRFSAHHAGFAFNSRPFQQRKDSSFSFGDHRDIGFQNQQTEPAQVIMIDSMSPYAKTPSPVKRDQSYQSTPTLAPSEPKMRKPKQSFSRSKFFMNCPKLPAGCASTRIYNTSPAKPEPNSEFSLFSSFAANGAPLARSSQLYTSNQSSGGAGVGYLLKKKSKEKILLPLTARPSVRMSSPVKRLSGKFLERIQKSIYLQEEN